MTQENILAVIPARDEETTVGEIVRSVRQLKLDVVVIDDLSCDRTAECAREAGAVVLSAPFNHGSWAAIQTGIRYAKDLGYSGVVTLDADGQHDPSDIPLLLSTFSRSPKPNLIIASFPERGSRLRKVAWKLLRVAGFLPIVDLTSGFRCYDRSAIDVLSSEHATLLDFQDVGVLILLLQNGLIAQEVPVTMRSRASGKSRIFSSWGRVFYYMIYSLTLSFSKARATPRLPYISTKNTQKEKEKTDERRS